VRDFKRQRQRIEVLDRLRAVLEERPDGMTKDELQVIVAGSGIDLSDLSTEFVAVMTADPSAPRKFRLRVMHSATTAAGPQHASDTLGDDAVVRILHLSDLHFTASTTPATHLSPLIDDWSGLGEPHVTHVVLSGDLTDGGQEAEFERLADFVRQISGQMNVPLDSVIVVPGNHDVDWNEPVYSMRPKRLHLGATLNRTTQLEQQDVVLTRDESLYPSRLKGFWSFSSELWGDIAPASATAWIRTMHEGLLFLCLNSAWEIDEFFPHRASIDEVGLSHALTNRSAREHAARDPIKIAVVHHPISGNEKIEHDAFLERLGQNGFNLVLHGHVHETRADVVRYTHPTWRIHAIGSGTFGAKANKRPESTPRLYNIVEIDGRNRSVRVEVRCRHKEGGAWEAWPHFVGEEGEHQPFYTFSLPESHAK
jgi:predicted MPP superfamily phosphohydrolase